MTINIINIMYYYTLNQYNKSYTTPPCIYSSQPSWTPSWMSQPAQTMATGSRQIQKLQGMTSILVYNNQYSTLVASHLQLSLEIHHTIIWVYTFSDFVRLLKTVTVLKHTHNLCFQKRIEKAMFTTVILRFTIINVKRCLKYKGMLG